MTRRRKLWLDVRCLNDKPQLVKLIWAWLCAEAGSARRSALEAEDVDRGEPAWRAPESFVPDARQVFFLPLDLGLA